MKRAITASPGLKIALAAVFFAVAAAFFIGDLQRYLSLEYLKTSRESLHKLRETHPSATIFGYAALYVTASALSLPGAAVLTLAAGALFGPVLGTVVVSFASSIGATLACLIARVLLRDWVQRTFHDTWRTVNEGVAREGAFYLFSLRLVPVFPFFAVNLVMGLTSLRLTTFYWVSQIGMLPGTVLYVNAGTELSRIDSLSGIVSPGVMTSLAMLGVFPLAARKIVAFYRKRFRAQGPVVRRDG